MKCPFEHWKYDFLSQCTGTVVEQRHYRVLFKSWPEIPWGFGNSNDIKRERHVRYVDL